MTSYRALARFCTIDERVKIHKIMRQNGVPYRRSRIVRTSVDSTRYNWPTWAGLATITYGSGQLNVTILRSFKAYIYMIRHILYYILYHVLSGAAKRSRSLN